LNRTVLIVGIVIAAAVILVLYLALGTDPQAIRSPLVGKPAPEFALREAGASRTLDLRSLRGKPVVINFWATWCGPCYLEHPVLVENARALGSQVQFVGVVFDDSEDKILKFLRENGTSYPTLLDERGKTAIAYGVGGVPETFFVDASGKIVTKHTGPMSTADLQQKLSAVTQ
jgi:cytochrome c biogenesis protein CcmG/thiol:disulfide interchange protein DsbE